MGFEQVEVITRRRNSVDIDEMNKKQPKLKEDPNK